MTDYEKSTNAESRVPLEPIVRHLDYIVEHMDDAGTWSQLGLPQTSEAEACAFLGMWRRQNPTQKFRLVERMTQKRVMDA